MSSYRFTTAVVRRLVVPMRDVLRAAHGSVAGRELVLVELVDDIGTVGWGECAALSSATYGGESVDSTYARIVGDLVPRLLSGNRSTEAAGHAPVGLDDLGFAAEVSDAPMAVAAVEMAYLDCVLRRRQESLASWMGATRRRVPAGVVIGRTDSLAELADAVERFGLDGYRRVKVKIEPGWDIEVAREAVRAAGAMIVQVDANGSFDPTDPDHLAALHRLDGLGLAMIEQPFPADRVADAARVARSLVTPLCVDEGASSPDATIGALEKGASSVACLKPGRLGGLERTRDLADHCARRGWSAWAGGMVESAIGKAALLTVAALDACDRVGDISASSRWFDRDLAEPFVVEDGEVALPTGDGLGVDVDRDFVESLTIESTRLT